MDYLIGTVIDNRYEILEQVGSGGMATVYKAKCRVLDRYVAIKILKDSLKNDIDVVKKFNTESRAAARLSHPNIVQVYDVSETGKFDYIVMEYVDGITLKEYITSKGHLETEEACEFAAQIGRALVCAHANGIVHRDIKPHNVLMAPDGTVKVADFGIAQATTSETMVAGGGAMGSVHYLSPEQARGGFTNERSDIYSLGIVLYEMLTGEVPFDGANPVTVALAKLEKDPEDIREKCAHHIPDSVCNIAMKAISKEQHSRYQSAAEMVSDLERVLHISSTKKSDKEEKFETKRLKGARDEYNMRKNSKRKKKYNVPLISAIVAASLLLIGGLFWLGTQLFAVEEEVKVPNIVGMTREEAEDTLKKAGLRLGNVEEKESENVPEGRVCEQNPEADSTVKKGRAISIKISSGAPEDDPDKELVDVPDVVDLKVEEAERRIRKAGFECVIEEEESETIAIGHVIRQEPDYNEQAESGSVVTIYVSGQGDEIPVPKVTGLKREEAERILKEAGFEIGDMTTGEDDSEKGTVISQYPEENKMAFKGTRVDLVVSQGPMFTPPPTEEPDHGLLQFRETTLSVVIPDGESESVEITVTANGQEFYSNTHKRSEKIADIKVKYSKDITVQTYIDGTLVQTKEIKFDKR